MSQVVINVPGVVDSIYVDNVRFVAQGTTPPPDPTPIPPNPIPVPPGGNPNAIVPVPNPWNAIMPANDNIHPSGYIAAYTVAVDVGRASVQFTQGQAPVSGAGTITEMYLSRTPGVIPQEIADKYAGQTSVNAPSDMYYKSGNINNNAVTIYNSLPPGITPEYIAASGAYYAPASQGPWYVNTRWTTSTGSAGFSMQWALGPW